MRANAVTAVLQAQRALIRMIIASAAICSMSLNVTQDSPDAVVVLAQTIHANNVRGRDRSKKTTAHGSTTLAKKLRSRIINLR